MWAVVSCLHLLVLGAPSVVSGLNLVRRLSRASLGYGVSAQHLAFANVYVIWTQSVGLMKRSPTYVAVLSGLNLEKPCLC
jgi:hypothetical protein